MAVDQEDGDDDILMQAAADDGLPDALITPDHIRAYRQVCRETDVAAYLDDTYLMGAGPALVAGISRFQTAMRAVGLELNVRKTKFWSPSIPIGQAGTLEPLRVDSLNALGTPVPYARASAYYDRIDVDDRSDVPLDVTLTAIHPTDFITRQTAYFDRLLALQGAGLPTSDAMELLQTWSQGAGVHIIRGCPTTRQWQQTVDAAVLQCVRRLLGMPELTRA